MLRVLFSGVGFLIDWDQAHEPHQTTYPVTAEFTVIALHVPYHFARYVPMRLQKLLVDNLHEPQVLGSSPTGV